ncbi:WYL domain-containing protein [uncultured Chryseobacterium sp.]|uniref:helix-turn-helix transcriptional regulator n=1 Tax=uncultured Chryseobacterium sp. TaxID=259322 RepID=UPI00260D73C8|nr:WYL domain-containing protein [uncultured Chryseobacterium sp.]
MPTKSERLMKIYGRLKRGPVTIEVIKNWAVKNDLKFSERTFYRDLKSLENSVLLEGEKIEVQFGEKNKKTWRLEYDSTNEKLDEFDINSYILLKNFVPFPVTVSRKKSLENIESIFYKTQSKSRFVNFMAEADQQIKSSKFYETADSDAYLKILNDMIWAVQNQKEIALKKFVHDYTSIAKSVKYPVLFLRMQLLYHRGVVHIAGFIKENKKLLVLALEQIMEYKLTNDSFNSKKLLKVLAEKMIRRFGITENINDEVYDIEIEFTEATGTFVKHHFWHGNQKFEQQKNGNYLMKMNCGINRELVGWIFQWMSNVRVIKPPLLQELVLAKYKEVVNDIETEKPLVSNNSFRKE